MVGLSLFGLTRRFGEGQPTVDGIDLVVADKEFVVLVGPSGCGKSTTLRLIAGLDAPDAGTIHIGEREVQGLDPGARDVAMVFQNYALYPHMTVARNLGFGLRKRGLAKAERVARVKDAARMLEIEDLLDRRPAALSGGQRQRVAMGRALVREPALFLFDEPLSNLDARLRTQMRTEIKRMSRVAETTSIFVTHDQVEAMTMADRVVVMRDGRIEQAATPMQIYHQPATRFVAEFVGSPAMTILPAQIGDGGQTVSLLGQRFEVPNERQADFVQHSRRRIEIGFRPEDMRLGGPVPARVEVVEALGVEALVHVATEDGPRCSLRMAPVDAPRTGDKVGLLPDIARAHLIDPASGRVLSAPPIPQNRTPYAIPEGETG
ncbi:ABC transporter ATP-binding protein [Qingshengfaniella alkalisoli]|uniref:sn-glycerol-3-phosphate ABC transporter ATP-binding protein UgpC n=1 Tax=Qingshengfaniella alkalisoli TaxID=2599296 RepID=A0A5B8IC39_9RHOB|nr:sn-glycerol-3-phosphate ABC transporter ATP-binding protein UgpC [Qingshengfaniella alkalisoli]QDY71096.1 sn-glycerol-3-phosphate ABC transporter ATP-binding protein UgpC [Qingshengfaniella alkalisoli]